MRHFLLLALALAPMAGRAQALTNSGSIIAVQAGALLSVAGSVANPAGSTFTNDGTVQLTGDLTNAGTLASAGTLLFSGTTDQTFTPGPATVTNLTLSNTGAAGSNRLLLPNDLMVSSRLTLTQGLVRTQGSATLRLPDGGQVVGEAAGQYVQGRLAVTRTAVNAGTGSVDFTNSFVINPNGQNLGAVTVTRTAGLQQAGVSYGTNLTGTNKGIDRVWQVTTGQPLGSAPASVTLSWVADDDNGFNPATPARLWRADQAAGPWVPQGSPASASARSFTANANQLGVLTVSNTSAPLPVTLVAFAARRQANDGLLTWTTASELNNAYFEVENSADGLTFRPLGRVAGAGTSTQAHQYQFVDSNLAHYGVAQVYYRLRQVDTDGTGTYSPVRSLLLPALALSLYPNPSHGTATVTGATPNATLTVRDALGQLVSQYEADAAGTVQLQLPAGLATGVYVVQTGTQTRRLVLE